MSGFNNGNIDANAVERARQRGLEEMAAARAAIKNNQDDRAANGLTPTKAQRVAAGLKQVVTHAPLVNLKKTGWAR